MRRVAVSILALVAVSGWASDALATLEFAQVLMAAPYERSGDCRLCHAQVVGSAGTAIQPFAATLKRYGIDASSSGGDLEAAILELGEEDSDGDGMSDLEELLSGGDPNESCGTPQQVLVYEYGCANLVGSRSQRAAWFGLFALGLLARRRASASEDKRTAARPTRSHFDCT
jgi:hypothetical protein